MRRGKRRSWIRLGGALLVLGLAGTASWASNTVTMNLFPPEAFYRNAGAPAPFVRTFDVPSLRGIFVLHLGNGSPAGENLVSSAVVKVNGVTAVKTSDLNQQVTQLDVPLANLMEGANTLSVEVRSIPSSYITVSVLGTYVLDVAITAPADGDTLDGDRVDVEGTWEAYTADVGLTVNGVPAAILGGAFAASGVRLDPGTNSLEAVIATVEGISDADAVSVTATGQEPEMELRTNLSSGAAPLEVTFLPRTRGIAPVEYHYDFEGDGVVDLTAGSDAGVSFTYENPGIYRPALTAILADGTSFQSEALLLVEDRSAVDALLTGRWVAVSSALQAQSVEAALASFVPESQEKYRRLFTGLADELPAIYASLPTPEFVKVQGHLAQYRIRRSQLWEGQPKTLTYYVWYARDAQGLWKVRAY